MAAKFGADRIEMLDRRLRMMGQADGINFTQQGKVGNTRDAHRLAQLAKTKGLETQNSVMAELFRSYFEEGGDVTSREMLITAGKKGGLEETEVKGWLESDEGGKEVDQEVDQACRAGVHSVPNFTINGRFTVYGAQGVEDFLGEFIAAKEEATKSSGFQKPSMGC
jgi:predicted DsbA family dithiol-disulfide isomerase